MMVHWTRGSESCGISVCTVEARWPSIFETGVCSLTVLYLNLDIAVENSGFVIGKWPLNRDSSYCLLKNSISVPWEILVFSYSFSSQIGTHSALKRVDLQMSVFHVDILSWNEIFLLESGHHLLLLEQIFAYRSCSSTFLVTPGKPSTGWTVYTIMCPYFFQQLTWGNQKSSRRCRTKQETSSFWQ